MLRVLLVLLSTGGFYLAAPSISPFWMLGLFCLSPWLKAVDDSTNWKTLLGYYLGISFMCNLVLHFWMPMALTEMWKFPLPVSALLWSPVAFLSEFHFFLWPFLLRIVFKKKIMELSVKEGLVWSILYATLEKGMSFLAPDEIGMGLVFNSWTMQIVDISGVSLASAILFFINLSFYRLIYTKNVRFLATTGLISALVLGYGIGVKKHLQYLREASHEDTKVLIIQPNLHHTVRDEARTGRKSTVELIMNAQYDQTKEGLRLYPKPDFVFWPETTYPFYFESAGSVYEEQTENKLRDFVKEEDISLFFGSYGKKPLEKYVHNNVYLLSPHAEPKVFEKTILFPFGEYVPFVRQFPWLTKIFPNASTPIASPEIRVEDVISSNGKKYRVGASICYEVFFESIFRNMASRGVDFSFNASNESWFYKRGEPQHALIHSQLKAAMTKKPIFRSANTGHSAIIDESGEILDMAEMDVKTTLYKEIKRINYGKTLYMRFGDWFSTLGFLLLIFMLYRRLNLK